MNFIEGEFGTPFCVYHTQEGYHIRQPSGFVFCETFEEALVYLVILKHVGNYKFPDRVFKNLKEYNENLKNDS